MNGNSRVNLTEHSPVSRNRICFESPFNRTDGFSSKPCLTLKQEQVARPPDQNTFQLPAITSPKRSSLYQSVDFTTKRAAARRAPKDKVIFTTKSFYLPKEVSPDGLGPIGARHLQVSMDQDFHRESSGPINPLIYELDQQHQPQKINKMQKARLQKQQVDFHSRKFKVFLALKPILIQQYKHQMIEKFEREMGIKRALYKYITHVTLRTYLTALASKFSQQRDYNLKRNRRVWSALLIKIRFKRKLKRFGPDLETRLRR